MNRDLVLLAIVLLWALMIRGYLVPLESPWYDELITLENLGAPSLSSFLAEIGQKNSPTQPQYFVLEYAWGRVFGADYMSVRWLSVVLGLISLGLVFLIGREIEGRMTGFVAALSLASSQVHIEYSLEIRMYMLSFVWAMVSVYVLLRMLKRPTAWWMTLHILSSVGLVWSHAFGVFLLPVEAIAWIVWGPRSWKWQSGWFSGQLAAAGSLAIWYAQSDQSRVQQAMAWLPPPRLWFNDAQVDTSSLSVSLVGTWYTWLVSADFYTGLSNPANLVPFAIYGGLIVIAMGLSIRIRVVRFRSVDAGAREDHRDYILWLVLWWLLPSFLLYVLSHLWRPMFFPRYVLYSCVPPFLMAGWSIAQMNERPWKRLGVLAVVVLSLFMGYTNTRKPQRPPWDSVFTRIEQSDESGGAILLFSNSRAGNDSARRTIEYLRPGIASRLRASTTSQEFAAHLKTVGRAPAIHAVLLGSGPLATLDEYLASQNLTFTTTYIPARFPLTLYRIEGFKT